MIESPQRLPLIDPWTTARRLAYAGSGARSVVVAGRLAGGATPGYLHLRLEASRDGADYRKEWSMLASSAVCLDLAGLSGISIWIDASEVTDASGSSTATASFSPEPRDESSPQEAFLARNYATGGAATLFDVPSGAVSVALTTALASFRWTSNTVAGTAVYIPCTPVAGADLPVLGARFELPAATNTNLVWKIRL